MIPKTAAQTKNAHTVIGDHPIVNAVAPLRRAPGIAGIVISVDIQNRGTAHGDEKAQIAGLQIAAGQDQVVVLQPPGQVVVPQGGTFFIGDGSGVRPLQRYDPHREGVQTP